jgi:arylsulfatase A-like enzyme
MDHFDQIVFGKNGESCSIVRRFLRAALRCSIPVIAMLLCTPYVRGDEDGRTNIVFILADDLGYTDVACYGSKYYETPNIDRLAAEGVRFTDGYACGPNCQPTRAALLSGQYSPRTGVYTVGSIDRFNWRSRPLRPVDNVTALPLDKTTIAQTLQKAGYATAMFGKWHLGNGAKYHPHQRGFDEAIVSAGKHFNFRTDPRVEYDEGEYLADFLTDRAIDFIKRHRTKPFFLYLPHFGVHAPREAKKELIERFRPKKAVGGHRDPIYAAMIASVDESVGRLLATLDELGLAENTLVIFASDNGAWADIVAQASPRMASPTMHR